MMWKEIILTGSHVLVEAGEITLSVAAKPSSIFCLSLMMLSFAREFVVLDGEISFIPETVVSLDGTEFSANTDFTSVTFKTFKNEIKDLYFQIFL